MLGTLIAEAMLSGKIKAGQTIRLEVERRSNTISITAVPQAEHGES
jgi:hypothetical protein